MTYPDPIIVSSPPEVFVIGHTQFNGPGMGAYLGPIRWAPDYRTDSRHNELVIEAAGRVCYRSWDNPAKKSTRQYISQSIVEHKHESVIEHVTINFMVKDLPRSVLMELSRHRVGTAMSFESTRFTFASMRLIMPPLIRAQSKEHQKRWVSRARNDVYSFYTELEDLGYDPTLKRKERKRIVEAARGHLPNEQGCDGVWTVNMRQLRHVMLLRSHPDADLSFREFVCQLWEPAVSLFPSVFADLEKITDEEGYEQIVRGV
jgi:thymidylate synthase (FAD)